MCCCSSYYENSSASRDGLSNKKHGVSDNTTYTVSVTVVMLAHRKAFGFSLEDLVIHFYQVLHKLLIAGYKCILYYSM